MTSMNEDITKPEFGLALGGGGARGLAHIHVLEVLDELGLRPKIIAGTSIGAIFGAAYASGLSGKEIREIALNALGKRISILKNLFAHKPKMLMQLWNVNSRSLLTPETLLEHVFPEELQTDFESLKIPLKVVATDYYNQSETIIESGPILPAVAASMAIPAVFRPVTIEDKVFIDGGLTNPLPSDILAKYIKQIIAIDVTGGPVWDGQEKLPTMVDVLFASANIAQNTIVREKIKQHTPTLFLKAPVDSYSALAFHKIRDILQETVPFRDTLKQQIEEKLEKTPICLGYDRN